MTPEQVKKRFEREGKTFTGWARENGFDPRTVIAVVNGVNKERYGRAHEVAVALGIKEVA
ncbi:MAG: DNA-binding protein [Candidatus Dactylopiibacterium carminicum]|uniref:DNA-binding protein n=2 Tax=Candidatus Dactylopiibacterium carminicum TaxID=857335 RepID=A0A272EXH3_9RHOO|nr:DNA-binding protein [Candidatus Dactylopiibacterium carminicum]PAS94818.1 MAG: DNA-binding protein [Candidatus Dactylopiibacterium carminicum]PAS97742.1 MAG: DNA-binding protein [Candidatus Dactylopiibacterium carminicum]PAT00166.1 MAG: DNA-binding protein [Candidatus Dactylopiibacterium carminicum]